jgi:hypothetical protein
LKSLLMRKDMKYLKRFNESQEELALQRETDLLKEELEDTDSKSTYTPFGLPVEDLFKYVFHLANPKNRERILIKGIEAYGGEWANSYGNSNVKAIFASNSPYPEDWFDFGLDYDVWAIDVDSIKNKWYKDQNAPNSSTYIATPDSINRSAIKLIHKGDGQSVTYDGWKALFRNKNLTDQSKLSNKRKNMVIPQSFR